MPPLHWGPIYRVFGVGLLACSLTGLLWSFFPEHQMALAESSVLAVLYLFLVVCVVYPQAPGRAASRTLSSEDEINAFRAQGKERLTPGVKGVALDLAVRQCCEHIARQYSLSPREAEVLVPLVKGMTRSAMCDELLLSEGTIKTHLTHIHSKLGIHSQAELFDIVYGVGEK